MTFDIIDDPFHTYFVTAKIEGGKHLFTDTNYAKVILQSLKFLRDRERIMLFAFVIMPNHVHCLFKPLKEWSANQICTDFEKFTAHQILKLLKVNHQNSLLDFFANQAKGFEDRDHKIWQNVQAKNCYSEKFLNQKIKYIHNNPINKGWQLVKDRREYPYSSAIFYDSDYKIQPIIEVDNLWNYLYPPLVGTPAMSK